MSYPDLSLATTHIGSLPFTEVEEALAFSFNFDIPAWPQLPKYKEEGMLWQFVRTFPGIDLQKERILTDTSEFEEGMLRVYEDYVAIWEERKRDLLSKQLERDFSKTFFPFLEKVKEQKCLIVKGQITGPFTLGISLKTDKGETLIFREDLRDLLVKYLTLKALAQAYFLKQVAKEVILFIDEPGLAGFGSSAYITLSRELVLEMLKEILNALKEFDCLTGIHVCANTSWDILLDSGVDIISFDSFSYFDRLAIFSDKLAHFLSQEKKFIAWGAVPTDAAILENLTAQQVLEKFQSQFKDLAQKISLEEGELLKKSMLTPSCGLGSLNEEKAQRVLSLLSNLKENLKP